MKTRTLVGVMLLVAFVAIALVYFVRNGESGETLRITNFEECVEAGFPVMESYPEQCNDGNQTFTRDIGNELEKSDLIKIETPRPGATIVVGKEQEIRGEARGYWFFEGDFPLEIVTASGEQILTYYATAETEWMTEEFVPFSTEITLEGDYEGPATLVLRRDNPSGLAENDDALVVPVVIEISLDADPDQSGEVGESDGGPLGESSEGPALAGCFVGGCSGQICSDDPDAVSTCEWREEYGCYKNATCERQASGECGWTQTGGLAACLSGARSGVSL